MFIFSESFLSIKTSLFGDGLIVEESAFVICSLFDSGCSEFSFGVCERDDLDFLIFIFEVELFSKTFDISIDDSADE